MGSALEDVVVVELTSEFWSGVGSALLADFGARVIRIEDLSRPATDADRDGLHPEEAFDADAELAQRNKRSVGLDLSTTEGVRLFERLVAEADVFFTDVAFVELEDRGWTYGELSKNNPGLVYVRGSGFGPRGRDRDLPALDELAAARTGVMPSLPQPGEPPVYAGAGQMHTAAMLAFGTMAALYHRGETGEGQVVDASLYGGNLYASTLNVDAYLAMRDDRLSEPIARLDAGNPMSGAGLSYPTSDGRWITLTMPDSDRWWPAFSKLMGIDTDDPRFDTHDKRCGDARHELMGILDGLFAEKPASHWRHEFDVGKFSADVIEKYDFVADYTQAAINRYVLDLEHPSFGRYKSIGFPIQMSDTPARHFAMAPGIGQHSAEVLDELLGMNDDEIAAFEADGVVGSVRKPAAHNDPVQVRMPNKASTEPAPVASGRRPLDGIRVLDFTVWFQGPVCSQFLADLGAEVIHMERPGSGDPSRGVKSINAVPVADWNQYFLANNRNKKSMAVDVKAGRELVHKLVAEADVFLWNQSMANLEPLGFDYETLSAINPRLIYATNSGYGRRGTNKPSFDMTVQALVGIMGRLGEPGQPPIYLGLGSGDAMGGLLSALGIMIALHSRRLTGRGQMMDASLLGSQILLAAPTLQRYLGTGRDFYMDQHSRTDVANPLWNRYQASDGWLFLCAENSDDAWSKVAKVIGDEALEGDARFADRNGRRDNAAALIAALDGEFGSRGAHEWVERLRMEGIVAAPINNYKDIVDEPQAVANDYIVRTFCSDAGGDVDIRGLPVTLGSTPGRVDSLGPELGQDTELILLDTLGMDWDEIAKLKEGVIP